MASKKTKKPVAKRIKSKSKHSFHYYLVKEVFDGI